MLFNHKNEPEPEPVTRPMVLESMLVFDSTSTSSSDNHENEGDDDDYVDDDEDEDEDDMYSDIFGHYFSLSKFKVEDTNEVSKVIKKEAYCFNVEKFAEKLVEATYVEANKALTVEKDFTPTDVPCSEIPGEIDYFGSYYDGITESIPEEATFSEKLSTTSSSFWPKISEFNIKLGLEKIERYVSKWKLSDDWKYCVEFLGFECEDCSNIFVCEVEWSKPTMSYPIPQATASVYFALEVFKMVPPNVDIPIAVTYIFEFSNVIHQPGSLNFQEKWLEDIIEAKLKFFKRVTFSALRTKRHLVPQHGSLNTRTSLFNSSSLRFGSRILPALAHFK